MTGFDSKRDMAADKLQEPEREALKLALEALELVNIEFVCNGAHHAKKDRHELGDDCPVTARYQNAITAIKEALAQPAQEPVCDKDPHGCWNVRCQLGKQCKNLAQPAQKPATYSAWGLMGGDEFVNKDSLNRNIT